MFVRPGMTPENPTVAKSVRKPNHRLLSPAGEEVGDSNFWQRRLRDGDVIETSDPPPATAPADITTRSTTTPAPHATPAPAAPAAAATPAPAAAPAATTTAS